MKVMGIMCVCVMMLAACSREGIQHEPQFTDWSYRTRDKSHNRYDGYQDYHIREEQWQTDPYWTTGEGLARRKAERARRAEMSQYDKEAAEVTTGARPMPMPPERFMKRK